MKEKKNYVINVKVVMVKISDLIENLVVHASRNDQTKSSVF